MYIIFYVDIGQGISKCQQITFKSNYIMNFAVQTIVKKKWAIEVLPDSELV